MLLNRLTQTILVVLLSLTLNACATLSDDDETKDWTARQLYEASKTALDTADYETALKYLETLESRYPFGRFAQQAQLDIIYAYYKFDEPESAIAAADRFIKFYPRHPKVDYAYYMRGLSSFNKGMGSLEYLVNLDPVARDPGAASESFQYFAALLSQFPQSIYARDAAQRMVYLNDNLAQHELMVANFYMERGAYVATVTRASQIVEKYQRTPAARAALDLLTEAYRRLDLHDLANDSDRVARLNSTPATTTPTAEKGQ
ncbi:MAG: outer membrane assembly lipoprotein YfiO [Halothiobacillaceae bacterium]|nr:MAG: outer membrane assembly lipoprotein YfiO [Halothiobacillaceae bacterium]